MMEGKAGEVELRRGGGGIGRKGEQRGRRDLKTSLRKKRKIELRSFNRMLKEKLHCIHHNELNSTNSQWGGE
jgi:hypothetical protein